MGEATLTPWHLENAANYRYTRSRWDTAGIESFVQPPAQNADMFNKLTNILPPLNGVLQRRFGYRSFLPKIDAGTSFNSDEVVGGNNNVGFAARRLFDYESDSAGERTIIGSASNQTGILGPNNNCGYFDAVGNFVSLLTPSNGADDPTVVTSRDYGYILDGVVADAKKWSIGSVVTKFGIAAPTTPITIGQASGGGATTYALSAVANASAGNTVYTGTALSTLVTGTSVSIAGFVNSANNGTFSVVSSTSTTVTVNNPSGVAETNPGTLTTTNKIFPTTLLNGWGPNAHVGSYEGGTNQGFQFGLDSSTTNAYSNPSNAFDGNENTYASASGQHTHVYYGCVWSFAAISGTLTNIKLNVLSEVPVNGTDGQLVNARTAGIWYSLDGGNNWQQVYDTVPRNKSWDQISLPAGQDVSKVQVMAFLDAHDDMYQKVYEINIQAQNVGNGPITLTNGRVYYQVFNNTVTGHYSDLSPVSTSTLAVAGAFIPLSNLAVSSDPQVTNVTILATADGGDPTILYFVGTVANGVTVFQDGVSEETLILSDVFQYTDTSGNNFGVVGNQPPPQGSLLIKHRGRLFTAVGQIVYFSKAFSELITSTTTLVGRYEESWPPENGIDISEESERIIALYSDGSSLYIGTTRHIRRVTGDGPSTFSEPEILFAETGVGSLKSWQTVFLEGTPVGAMWLTPDFRVIGSDFNTYQDVGTHIQDTLNNINPNAVSNVWGTFVADGPYNFYMLGIPTGTNTNVDTICLYDMHLRKWYIWRLTDNPLSIIFYYNLTGIPKWLFCDSTGNYWLVDPNTVVDRQGGIQQNVTSTIQTTWLDLGDHNATKFLNELELVTSDPNILVSVEGALDNSTFTTPDVVVSNVKPIKNFLGRLKVFLAPYATRHRWYRFSFVSTNTPQESIGASILSFLDIETKPVHRI